MALSDAFNVAGRNNINDLKLAFNTLESKFSALRPGPLGLAGTQGADGSIGDAGSSVTLIGNWVPGTTYNVNDAVFAPGPVLAQTNVLWRSLSAFVSTVAPRDDFANWQLVTAALKGPDGPQGPIGAMGPAGATGPGGFGIGNANGIPILPGYTVATLPSLTSAAIGGLIYIADYQGSAAVAYADGNTWIVMRTGSPTSPPINPWSADFSADFGP